MTTLFAKPRTVDSVATYGKYLSEQESHDTGEIVAVYDTISDSSKMDDKWLELGKQNQKAAKKHGNRGKTKDTKVQEARELYFWLDNQWCSQKPEQNQKLAKDIAAEFKSKFGLECMVALHWNKERTNFHCHIMYSDRRMLDKPIEIKATRNEYYNEDWKRCTKAEAVHIFKKGDTKEIKYFENVKDERCTDHRFAFHKAQLEPWVSELTGQQIFDRKSLKLAQQKIGKCKTKEAKERIKEENTTIKKYNDLVDEFMEYDSIDDDFFDYLEEFGMDLLETDDSIAINGTCSTDFERVRDELFKSKEKYLQLKKDAVSHSESVLERTKTNKRVWKRKYDPNFNHKHHQSIKFSQIENMYDLLLWILQILTQERDRVRWQKLNFENWQVHLIPNSNLAKIKIGNETLLVSTKTMRRNADRTYDVFLDLDQEIELDGQSMSVEELLVEQKFLKQKDNGFSR